MRCVVSSVSIQYSEFVLACLPKSARADSSWQPIWEAIAESFKHLASGKLADGTPVRKGVLFVIAGDLEWYSQEFGWPTAMSNKCCPYCNAENLFEGCAMPFTDFRDDACWKRSIKTFKDKAPADHPFFRYQEFAGGPPSLTSCT